MSTIDQYWRRLEGWRPLRACLNRVFAPDELAQILAARPAPDAEPCPVAYCVYENPFAVGGGVYQVAWNLARAQRQRGRQVVLLSPHHGRLATAPDPRHLNRTGQVEVPFGDGLVPVALLEPNWPEILAARGVPDSDAPPHTEARWVLLDAPGFFEASGGDGGTSPYAGGEDEEASLLRDSLLLCAAIPRALAALGLTRDVMVHAQDWALARGALTVKEARLAPPDGRVPLLHSAAVVLTSHNPYDRHLPRELLRLISARPLPGETVYQRMIPLTDAPVSTVSRTFARELTRDPLLAGVYAEHMRGALRGQGVVGVDNGPFRTGDPPFSAKAVSSARAGDPGEILEQKQAARFAMLRLLDDHRPEGFIGQLEGEPDCPATTLADDVPVFMMYGRLDPGQKGFDLLARAMELLPRGRARLVLAPSQASAGDPFLDDLARLAENRKGEVVIYPFILGGLHSDLVSGATFTVWPSLYEPFGGASESYLAGTPIVARATGGLVQQVVDADADPASGTGFLFAEDPSPPAGEGRDAYLARSWRRIQELRTPDERQQVPLYWHLVGGLAAALTRAEQVHARQPRRYGAMLANLEQARRRHDWDRAASEYDLLYGVAAAQGSDGR